MRLLAVVSYFAFFCSGTAVARQGYTNPVRDSNGDMVRVADPFVYRHGGVYYLIGTTRQHNGFDCYTSPDLVHWTFAGAAYTKPDGHYGTGSFWAPEVKYYNGKIYLTNSAYINRYIILSSIDLERLIRKGAISYPNGNVSIKIRMNNGKLEFYNGNITEEVDYYYLDNFDMIK